MKEAVVTTDVVLKTTTQPKTTRDVGEMLFLQLVKQREERRKMFLKLPSNARFLCRQGLPFRGNGDVESDSNFIRLVHLRSEDSADLITRMKQKTDKYTSHDMQNELIEAMGLRVLREIAKSLQDAPFSTEMVDETTDISNLE